MLTNDIGENITAYMFYLHTDYKKNRQNLAFLKSKLQCINHCRSSNESNGMAMKQLQTILLTDKTKQVSRTEKPD